MRAVIQRVAQASVAVEQKICGQISHGLLILLGIHKEDQPAHTVWLVNKLVHLRIFADEQGKMNKSLLEVRGQILVISQFTLYGNCAEGRRPDFFAAAPPEQAIPLYEKFVKELRQQIAVVETGIFGAKMSVSLINDGPVTLVIDSKK